MSPAAGIVKFTKYSPAPAFVTKMVVRMGAASSSSMYTWWVSPEVMGLPFWLDMLAVSLKVSPSDGVEPSPHPALIIMLMQGSGG